MPENNGTFTVKDIIKDIQTDVKEIRKEVAELKALYGVLNFKSSIWGALGGAIPAAIAVIYMIVK